VDYTVDVIESAQLPALPEVGRLAGQPGHVVVVVRPGMSTGQMVRNIVGRLRVGPPERDQITNIRFHRGLFERFVRAWNDPNDLRAVRSIRNFMGGSGRYTFTRPANTANVNADFNSRIAPLFVGFDGSLL
jgi:hypothetical protein